MTSTPRTHQIVNDGQPGAEPDEGGKVSVQPDQPLAFVGKMILEAIFLNRFGLYLIR
jgi:hypothetical protein